MSSVVVCDCVWLLRHYRLLEKCRLCIGSSADERRLTCSLMRLLDRCSDTSPLSLEAANHRNQIGRREWPCPLFNVRNKDTPQN